MTAFLKRSVSTLLLFFMIFSLLPQFPAGLTASAAAGINKNLEQANLSPGKSCTRAQIVTFLYRCYN